MGDTGQVGGNRVLGVVSALFLIGFATMLGGLLGGLYVRLFVPKTGMGWDQLADALGGLMLGGLLGFVAGVVGTALLAPRRRALAGAICAVLTVAVFVGLAVTAPNRTKSSEPFVREKPFQPIFTVKMRVGNSQEILAAVPEDARPYRFTEAQVRSGGPTLVRVGWGPDFARCQAEPTREDLAALFPRVQAAAAESTDTICRTPREDDLNLTFYSRIAGERKSATVQGDCLAERPAMAALAQAVAELAGRICAEE